MSEQKADKIQLEAMKLVSFELSSLFIFLYYIQYTLCISDIAILIVLLGFVLHKL